MYPGHNVSFASFQMNLTSYQIWCDGKPIPLQPMPARILAMLVQRADLIVPYAAFNTGIWGAGEHLDELKVHISTIRKVLGDQAKTPRFIQTYRGYGYQFMMPVTYDDGVREEQATVEAWPMVPLRQIVGREASLARLHDWLERAQEGTRQIVLVTGEAGIGKTTVVEAFVQQISVHPRPRLGQAQCLTHYGVSEPYMPILEALRQLCQPPEGHTVVTLLSRVAPTWLLQMPWLLSEEDAERLQRRTLGTTPQRMLREIVQALETLTHTRPLVLVLEDLHWSDTATLDVLSLLARRQETARLLLLGTYRPEEIRGTGHPLFALIQDLQMRGYCQELALPLLSVTAVRAYLTARFPGMPLPEGLAQFIHTRTDGNPLFMVNLIEHVASQGIVGAQAIDAAMELEIPHSLRQIIEQRLDQFTPEERQVCEVASVAGTEFTAAMVAAGMGESLELVETWCANLARRGLWLRSHGPRLWPDGTASEAYSFVHSLYQNVLYAQVTIARRQRLHRLLGACLERG